MFMRERKNEKARNERRALPEDPVYLFLPCTRQAGHKKWIKNWITLASAFVPLRGFASATNQEETDEQDN
jgi:hypothetical protein